LCAPCSCSRRMTSADDKCTEALFLGLVTWWTPFPLAGLVATAVGDMLCAGCGRFLVVWLLAPSGRRPSNRGMSVINRTLPLRSTLCSLWAPNRSRRDTGLAKMPSKHRLREERGMASMFYEICGVPTRRATDGAGKDNMRPCEGIGALIDTEAAADVRAVSLVCSVGNRAYMRLLGARENARAVCQVERIEVGPIDSKQQSSERVGQCVSAAVAPH